MVLRHQGVTGDFFERIRDKHVFETEVFHDFNALAEERDGDVAWNRRNAYDAFFAWQQDLERLNTHEPNVNGPDHLKCAAYLIYWLRRSSPIAHFVWKSEDLNVDQQFLHMYGREYFAFDLGYRAAQIYECKVDGRDLPEDSFSLHSSLSGVKANDFIATVSHVLKAKEMSPHALLLILKAIFLRP